MPLSRKEIHAAIEKLGEQFPRYDWIYREVPGTQGQEVRFDWYGGADEDVMVCAHVGRELHEKFHRHGFVFFNYAYEGDYQALSHSRYNLETIREGQMYVGQPFSGYALRGNAERDIVILGVLVRTETFYRDFLPLLVGDAEVLDFYLGPRNNLFSDKYLQVTMPSDCGARELLELMAVEYAFRRETAQRALKPYAIALAQLVAREWHREHPASGDGGEGGAGGGRIRQAVLQAISRDLAHASLSGLARQLGYNPNYLSSLIRKECGSTFSQLLLEQRMDRAALLLERTTMSVEEVARTVGYTSTSNFYKAYRKRFGHSPRE